MTNIEALIASKLAMPFTHAVKTTYADGAIREHQTRSAAQAENWAIGERHKIGEMLISRATGKMVKVVSVEIVELGAK